MKIGSHQPTTNINHEIADGNLAESQKTSESSELQGVVKEFSDRGKAQLKSEMSIPGQARAAELHSIVDQAKRKLQTVKQEMSRPLDWNAVKGGDTEPITHITKQEQITNLQSPGVNPADSAPEPSFPTLRRNDSRTEDVEAMQRQLNEWRVKNGRHPIKEDGKFGPETEAAVRDFQKAKGLQHKNGVADNHTHAALRQEAISGAANRFLFDSDRMKLEGELAPNFHPTTRKNIESMMSAYSDNSIARQNLIELVKNPYFRQLPPQYQEEFLMRFQKDPSNVEHLEKILRDVKIRSVQQEDGYIPKLGSPGDPKKPISL